MTADEWRRAGAPFAYRGHEIFHRDAGIGDPVLCIHGFPTASYDWHRVWPRLSRRFRLLAPDMIGFGFSAKPVEHPYSIGDQASLHEALVRQLGIERVHILAHDYGDTVAQELLARDLEARAVCRRTVDILSVCFLNGGLFPEVHRARVVQRVLAGPLGPIVGRLLSERRFGRGLAAVFGKATRPSAAELHELWKLVAFNEGARVAHKLIGYMEERRRNRERWVGALQQTRVPLRLVDGADDPVSGRHMAERYAALVPRPDVIVLEGIGHYPQLEAPDRVADTYLEFIARVNASARERG